MGPRPAWATAVLGGAASVPKTTWNQTTPSGPHPQVPHDTSSQPGASGMILAPTPDYVNAGSLSTPSGNRSIYTGTRVLTTPFVTKPMYVNASTGAHPVVSHCSTGAHPVVNASSVSLQPGSLRLHR